MPNNQRDFRLVFGRVLQTYGLLLMVIVLLVIFTFLNERFFTLQNLKNILEQNAALAIVAVGVTFSIISGNFDLSPGAAIALAGVVLALVYTHTNNMWIAAGAALGVSLLVGLFNGALISYFRINSVIVTLAAMIWARGLALGLTSADSIPFQSRFVEFMNNASFLGVSPIILLIILSFVLGWFLLGYTRLGRYTYALGGDSEATKQAGVNTALYTLLIFLISAFLVWTGTLVTVSRLSAGAPNAVYGLEFDAIVAVIIGGNSMTGGEGNLGKTLIGVLFIAILNNGLSTLGMRDSSFYLYKGFIILIALFFEVMSRRMIVKGQGSTLSGNETVSGH
ncbi:MAG: ABC transporter permease [Anaerolineae bacterium]|nr:ABC transporter permease [Anaerolineae bacterium]